MSTVPSPDANVLDTIHGLEDQAIQQITAIVHARVNTLPFGPLIWASVQSLVPLVIGAVAEKFHLTPKS